MNTGMLTSRTIPANGEAAHTAEILTVLEVAHFLRVPKSTVYKLARRGQLPARRIGKHWRFLWKDIEEWVQRRSEGQNVIATSL